MITPAQCRAARGLIGWNQGQLAEAANVARQTINDFETGKRMPIANNLVAIERAFAAASVVFIDEVEGPTGSGRGVRFALPESESPDLQERLKLVAALSKSMGKLGR